MPAAPESKRAGQRARLRLCQALMIIWPLLLIGQAHAASVVAVASRIEIAASVTRLTFDLTASVAATAFVLSDPDRVVVDLPEVNFQIDGSAGRAENLAPKAAPHPNAQGRGANAASAGLLIRAYRFGLLGQGRSRIVIDLAGPARIIRAVAEPVGSGPASRLVIELARTDRPAFVIASAFAAQAQANAVASLSPPPALNVAAPGRPVIVLDPGHGGIDAGASGLGGSIEKSLVFDFAKALRSKLEASGRYQVVLTRSSDSFVSLSDRVRIARDHHAALFVSIHADTLAKSALVQGATIYTLSEKASDKEAARIADKENQSDSAAGIVGSDEASGVSDILFDLTRRETRAYSHLFAKTLVGVWQAAGKLNKNPQRAAGFVVLKAPDVPSILIELGYLSSDKDVAALKSAEWRDKATGAIADSIAAFFARPPAGEGQTAEESKAVSAATTVAPVLH